MGTREDEVERRLNLIPKYDVVEEVDDWDNRLFTLGPVYSDGTVGTMENMLGQIFDMEYNGEIFSAFLVEAQHDLRYLIDRVRTLEGQLQARAFHD